MAAIPETGEVLTIYNIKRYCDDVYTCTAFNDVGSADHQSIRVRVRCRYLLLSLSSPYDHSRTVRKLHLSGRTMPKKNNLLVACLKIWCYLRSQLGGSLGFMPQFHGALITLPTSSFTVKVDVTLNNKELYQDIGKSTILTCVIKGYPLKSSTWYKNGSPIDYSNTRKYKQDQYNVSM